MRDNWRWRLDPSGMIVTVAVTAGAAMYDASFIAHLPNHVAAALIVESGFTIFRRIRGGGIDTAALRAKVRSDYPVDRETTRAARPVRRAPSARRAIRAIARQRARRHPHRRRKRCRPSIVHTLPS